MTGTKTEGSRPLRVLFVSNDPPGATVTRYRCENIAASLRESGIEADVVYVGAPRVQVRHDVVVLHRICRNAEGRRYLSAARRIGAVVVYGADDLVFEQEAFPPDAVGMYGLLRQFAPRHLEMLRAADAVLLSTEFLAERTQTALAGQKKPVFVLRNFLSPDFMALASRARSAAPEKAEHSTVTVAYVSGSATHDGDLASVAEATRDVLSARPHVELLLVGPVEPPEALSEPAIRLRRQGFVPWRDVPGVLAQTDICLAPLELEPPLNHGKSEIKMLEAAAAGVPTLASASAGFREALQAFPEGGVLAFTPAEWKDALTRLIDDADYRVRIRDNAQTLLSAQGTEPAQRAEIATVFAKLAALKADSRPAVRKSTIVHWPTVPPKYLAKRALSMWRAARRRKRV